MKKTLLVMAICCLTFLVACGGSGGSNDAINPYGFVVASYDSTNIASLKTNDIRAIAKPSVNSSIVYIGTDKGLFSFNSSVATPVFTSITAAGMNTKVINNIVNDTNGDMYVCATDGLYKYDGTTFTAEGKFANENVLTFSRRGTSKTEFWVGLASTTNCIAKSDSGTVTFYGKTQGIVASSVRNIYATDDMVMACTVANDTSEKGGIFKYFSSGTSFSQVRTTVGLAKGATTFFTIGSTWYAGGPDSGLITSTDKGTTWTQTALNNCTPVDFDTQIMNSLGTPRYWISTDKALYLTYDFTNFQPYDTTKNMAGNSTNNVLSISQGLVWAANDGISGGLSQLAFDGN